MTFMTHRQFAVFWALAGTMLLYVRGMTEINYYLALIIVLPIAKVGAEFPDYDHLWQNVKNKTIISWIINKLIHVTGGTHRSWQTHSIDIAVAATFLAYYLPKKLFEMDKLSAINREVLNIIMIGFALGWLSHIFSDMLTTGKVKLFFWANIKICIVPKRIFGLRFNTGNEWEQFVYTVTRMLNGLVGIIAVAFPFIYTENGMKILNNVINIIKI